MREKLSKYIITFIGALILLISVIGIIYTNIYMITINEGLVIDLNYNSSNLNEFLVIINIILIILGVSSLSLILLMFNWAHMAKKNNFNSKEHGNSKLHEKHIVDYEDSNMTNIDKRIFTKEIELKEKSIELENITKALKEKEEKLEYDKLKTEFFANISHEFKTPLNILMGAIQLIDLYTYNGIIIDPDLKLNKYLKTMKQNSFRLLRLINNIIDLTKIDSSYFYLEEHNYDIVKIVEGVIESINIYSKVKSINVTFKKEIDKQIMACDADKVERILLNILSNSLKFTDENGNIEVRIWSKDNNVFISVKDDGIGIQEEKLKVIFQRFRQVDKSFTRNREGSGIGLSLVKALTEMHEGKVTVKSDYGEGSEFIILLPIRLIDEEVSDNLYSQFEDRRMERVRIEFSDI